MASSVKQALCILGLVTAVYTNPLPTPPPIKTGTATAEEVDLLGKPTCATVLTSLITGFQGHFTAGVIKTVYTETITEHEWVACGGCELSITTELASDWGGHGPQQIITATTTVRHASTTTLTACLRHSNTTTTSIPTRGAQPAVGERNAVTKPPTHRPRPVSPTLTRTTIDLVHS